MTQKVALVTGASAGMGKDFVKALLDEGMVVYAAARRVENMEDIKALGAHPLKMDITKEDCVPNQYKVKYYHLGFVTNEIFGHIFNGISPATVSLAHIGVCSDILGISSEPLILTCGPKDEDLDEKTLLEMNAYEETEL